MTGAWSGPGMDVNPATTVNPGKSIIDPKDIKEAVDMALTPVNPNKPIDLKKIQQAADMASLTPEERFQHKKDVMDKIFGNMEPDYHDIERAKEFKPRGRSGSKLVDQAGESKRVAKLMKKADKAYRRAKAFEREGFDMAIVRIYYQWAWELLNDEPWR